MSIITAVSPIEITPLELNDTVRLRKPHACGGYEWTVVRLGADIGLKCNTCSRRVLLTRRELQRRLKNHLPAKQTHTMTDEGISAREEPAL